MIEYNDKKGGKIKVANVTEARANFADVLGDTHISYVVTKNNKPVRAIIDYEDFVLLRKSILSQNSLENSEVDSVDFPEMRLPRPERRQKSKSRVKGLLGSHQQWLGHKPPFDESQRAEVVLPREKVLEQKKAVGESLPAVKNYPQEVAEDDYFKISDEDFLVSPDEIETRDTEAEKKIEPPPREPPDEAPAQTVAFPVVQKSSQEQEYFDKYKKLYGSQALEPGTAEDLDRQIEERVEQLLKPKVRESQIHSRSDIFAPFKPETAVSAVKEVTLQQPKQAQKKTHLPSLKDLLKELDNEKLSGDDELLASDDEIDDLIHRIIQD